MDTRSTSRKAFQRLLAGFIWLVLLGLAFLSWKYFFQVRFKGKLVAETSAPSQYRDQITVAADAFSGYAFLRSDVFAKSLKDDSIKVVVNDDKADYLARAKALQEGKTNFAVFTLDAYLVAGNKIGDFPGTALLVIDETKGGDAIVAYKGAVPNVEALNYETAKFILTPDSPSEFLARVTIASFNLPRLPEKWFTTADGAGDVYQKFKAADKNARQAYVLWQPYVSLALQEPGAHVLLDSSKLKGYIVDVLLVERGFLKDHADLVKKVVEAYLKTAHSYNDDRDGLIELVIKDAQATGESLTRDQAAAVVDGIRWKGTTENYGHFGLPTTATQVETLEDIIPKITKVLVQTGAMANDPLDGKPTSIFYDGILKDLQSSNFHPGKKVNVLEGVGLGTADLPKAPEEKKLATLTGTDWGKLVPVGSLRVDPISFTRGTADISVQSRRDLNDLAQRLKSFPGYYLVVSGNTRREGDAEANRKLATARAVAARQYLLSRGIDGNRVKAEASNGGGQEVTFTVAEKPF